MPPCSKKYERTSMWWRSYFIKKKKHLFNSWALFWCVYSLWLCTQCFSFGLSIYYTVKVRLSFRIILSEIQKFQHFKRCFSYFISLFKRLRHLNLSFLIHHRVNNSLQLSSKSLHIFFKAVPPKVNYTYWDVTKYYIVQTVATVMSPIDL